MKTVERVLTMAPLALLLAVGIVTAEAYEQEVIVTGEYQVFTYSVENGLPVATVNLAGLDINSENDRAVVDSRLKRAARVVCGSTNPFTVLDTGIRSLNRQCAREAVGSAWNKLDSGDAVAHVDLSAHIR